MPRAYRAGSASPPCPAGLVQMNDPSISALRNWAMKAWAAASLGNAPASRRLVCPQALTMADLPRKASAACRVIRRQSKPSAALSRPVATCLILRISTAPAAGAVSTAGLANSLNASAREAGLDGGVLTAASAGALVVVVVGTVVGTVVGVGAGVGEGVAEGGVDTRARSNDAGGCVPA